MSNSPRLLQMAEKACIPANKCENCGHIESSGITSRQSNYVGFCFHKPGRLQANKVDSYKDFLVLCLDCQFLMAGSRADWFRRLRG